MSTLDLRPTGLQEPEGARDRQIPFTRLVRVEIRKMVDTRAGLWLLIAIGAITALVVVLALINARSEERTYQTFLAASAIPESFLLPVLGIMLVTGEWGQRTAMTTFALVPRRGRVVAAKLGAAIVLGLGAIALALALAALAALVGGAGDPWRDITAAYLGQAVLRQLLVVLMGFGFGLLLRNTPAAIVVYFALSMRIVFGLLSAFWKSAQPVWDWIDPGTTQDPLSTPGAMTGTAWAHLAVASLIWIAVPLAVGWWRMSRVEVK